MCVVFSLSLCVHFSQVSPDQVMLSHSPLRMFTQFHKMRVLVSGQGPVEEVAHKYPVLLGLFMLHLSYQCFNHCHPFFLLLPDSVRRFHHFFLVMRDWWSFSLFPQCLFLMQVSMWLLKAFAQTTQWLIPL